jgi:hypothetical protein
MGSDFLFFFPLSFFLFLGGGGFFFFSWDWLGGLTIHKNEQEK